VSETRKIASIRESRTTAIVKSFGRRPGHGWPGRRGAGVRKPPKDETAGRIWRCWGGRDLWDLKVTAGSHGSEPVVDVDSLAGLGDEDGFG
jgi:hypothetical protein